jgi:hypothetical protein
MSVFISNYYDVYYGMYFCTKTLHLFIFKSSGRWVALSDKIALISINKVAGGPAQKEVGKGVRKPPSRERNNEPKMQRKPALPRKDARRKKYEGNNIRPWTSSYVSEETVVRKELLLMYF